MRNKIVSVILARGGSKGIPRKNVIDLCGKPLIAYTIAASRGAGIEETWVSTDDAEIASAAKQYGAQVLLRPAELASDIAPSEAALLHFAKEVAFDWLVFIQPTSPLIESGDISKGIALMESGNYDSEELIHHF
jgi:N-acylneuraminate cytidylyltransferase